MIEFVFVFWYVLKNFDIFGKIFWYVRKMFGMSGKYFEMTSPGREGPMGEGGVWVNIRIYSLYARTRARQLASVAGLSWLERCTYRNRRTTGSIPAREAIVAFFATAPAWLGLMNV
jgi:hypothetical protein